MGVGLLASTSSSGLIMSQNDVKLPIPPTAVNSEDNALKLAQELIRKMDEESRKKLEQVSTEEKGAA